MKRGPWLPGAKPKAPATGRLPGTRVPHQVRVPAELELCEKTIGGESNLERCPYPPAEPRRYDATSVEEPKD